jgi:hypothetical protein
MPTTESKMNNAKTGYVIIDGREIAIEEFAREIGVKCEYGSLYLEGYAHPLPAWLTSVGGYLYLRGYAHPLPAGFASVGGSLYLEGYAHPLPAGFASVGGYLYMLGYAHPLPAGLTSVGGSLALHGYAHPLPDWIISAGSDRRGYFFAAVRQDGKWRVRAGCRDFSIETALSHWGPGGASDRPDCLALVKKIVAEIDVRGAV